MATTFRLFYYDQRGRGRSADGVQPDQVGIRSEVEDLDRVRRFAGLESTALLGHSWGGLLAMEYAIRHPDRVSHLILLDTAPASHGDAILLGDHLRGIRSPDDLAAMRAVAESEDFARGSLDAEAAYYRLHFKPTLHRTDQLEMLVGRLRSNFTPETVLIARAIEQRLYDQTWERPDYDLIPPLRRLGMPALLVHGEHDFIPLEVATRIADAIPGATLSVLPGCGHFTFLESPDAVHDRVAALITGS